METLKTILYGYFNWMIILPIAMFMFIKRVLYKEFKFLFIYLILAASTQLVSFITWKMKLNNLPILHLYTVLEFLILLTYYWVLLKGFLNKSAFFILIILFPILEILSILFVENIYQYNNLSRSVEALLLIFFSICWFVKIVAEDDDFRSQYQGFNYINAGFLLYFSGAITLFACSSFVNEMSVNLKMNIWTIHTLLAVQLYILISIGLWKARAK